MTDERMAELQKLGHWMDPARSLEICKEIADGMGVRRRFDVLIDGGWKVAMMGPDSLQLLNKANGKCVHMMHREDLVEKGHHPASIQKTGMFLILPD